MQVMGRVTASDDPVAAQVREWVRPREGSIANRVYVDRELFDAEVERIWKRSWLYAGHESEVAVPGSFVSRSVGTVPIILTRAANGELHVLVNQCAHRGNSVCQSLRGTASNFRCAYHGWTFRHDGRLIGLPHPGAYGADLDMSELGLAVPARVATYRGFVFISHSPGDDTIEDHLGSARATFDRFIDMSPTGRLRLDAGEHRTSVACNWKLCVENNADNYHASFVHISAFTSEAQRKFITAMSRETSLGVVRLFDNGHTELDFRPEQRALNVVLRTGNATTPTSQADAEHLRALKARHGDAAGQALYDDGPPLLHIYPNLLVIQEDVRRLEPVSVDQSLICQTAAMLDGVPDLVNETRLSRHQAAFGPAGFIIPDDMAIFARSQQAMTGAPDRRVVLSRGLEREHPESEGTVISHIADETGMRGGWQQYLKLMTATGHRPPATEPAHGA